MRAYITPEEHARNHRRRRRQLLGVVIAIFVLIGVITVVRSGLKVVAQLFDDTQQRQEYEDKLEGLVMFDPLPFEGLENIDDLTLREAAVWGCVYAIQEAQGSFDNYERDPETDQLLLPAVDVDAYLAKLAGPSFKLNHKSFEMEDMTVEFDEVSQRYRIPITGSVGYYRATVTSLFKKNGRLYVTVGYISTTNPDDLIVTQSDTPTKYMDYIFERMNGSWYLTGLTESETKPEISASNAAEPKAAASMEEDELQTAILAGVDPNAAASGEAQDGEDASAEDAEPEEESDETEKEAASDEAA